VIHAHHERIAEMLKTNTATTVHQRLRDEHGLSVGVSRFPRYLWLEFPAEASAEKVTVLRPDVEAGSEAQIDYGYLGQWRDPIADRVRRVWAFVVVLAFSRHMFVRPVLKLDQRSWTAAHVAALEFFGGCPARLVYENVPRHIFRLLWPAPLCGHGAHAPCGTAVNGLSSAIAAT